MKLLTEEERQAFLDKIPKPANNLFWEAYLAGNFLRTDRVGDVIEFARYGDLPASGRSRYQRTLGRGLKSYPELKGVSVFEVVDGQEVRPMPYAEDLFQRPRITGKGRIVGWGTDGEPLVEVLEWKGQVSS